MCVERGMNDGAYTTFAIALGALSVILVAAVLLM
jgi:hypothetical protein